MSRIRVCFLGTPDFAVTSLQRLCGDPRFEIVGVVTQPDRASGRKLQLTPSPVKVFSVRQGLRVISPEKINNDLILNEIANWGAEVAVVVAFGQILSTRFLGLFQFGAVNVHGSILPRWRGAAPIQRALEFGDTEGGVTLQKVVKELDAGDIIGTRKIALDQEITGLELYAQLAEQGADLLQAEFLDYLQGHLVPVAQDPQGVTYAKKIEKAECAIDWREPAIKIHNKVRGFNFGPGCSSIFQGKRLKIHRTRLSKLNSLGLPPGSFVYLNENVLTVETGDGLLQLLEVQAESRNRQNADEFMRSQQLKKGDRLEPFTS